MDRLDYEATCRFFTNDLGPANRTCKAKCHHFNGPVIGLEVDDTEAARMELIAKGAEFVSDIEGLEDGSVKWTYFWGSDGQFYSLHEHKGE